MTTARRPHSRVVRRRTGRLLVAFLGLLVGASAAIGAGVLPAQAASGRTATILHVSGDLETVVGDDFESGRATTTTSLVLDDGSRLPLSAGALDGLPQHGSFDGTVRVPDMVAAGAEAPDGVVDENSAAGRRLLDALVDRGRPVPVATAEIVPERAVAPAPSAHHAYVAIMSNAGDFGMSQTQLGDLVDGVTGFWVTQSDGVITSFDRASTQTFVSAYVNEDHDCGLSFGTYDEVWAEADDLFPGVSFTNQPNHLIVLVPNECLPASASGWGLVGTSLGNGGRVLAMAEGYGQEVLSHELGHNLSLGHANGSLGGEYADVYSVMGGPPVTDTSAYDLPVLGSAQRSFLGLLDPAEVADVALPQTQSSRTTTHTIVPRGSSSGLRTLRVADPASGEELLLDYRSGTGAEGDTFYQDGLFGGWRLGGGLAVVQPDPVNSESTLAQVDLAGDRRFTFKQGETYTNGEGSVSVTVTSVSAGALGLSVTLSSPLPGYAAPPAPELVGVPEVNETLEVELGAWPVDTFHEITWFVDGRVLIGDDGETPYRFSTLLLGQGLRGATIQVRVKSYDAAHRPIVQHTDLVGPVQQRVVVYAPYLFFPDPEVGTSFPATVASSTPSDATLTYQWNADGVPIPGAVATAYTPVAADVGKVLTITATGTRAGYLAGSATSSASDPVTSVATGPVGPGPDEPVELGTLATTRPTISGKAKVGVKLKAVTGSWTGGTSFTYRWLLNGKVVRGVRGVKWKLPASAKGKRVSVKVTGSKPGYATVTLTSAKTGKVKK